MAVSPRAFPSVLMGEPVARWRRRRATAALWPGRRVSPRAPHRGRQRTQAPTGLRSRERILGIPGVSREHGADHAPDGGILVLEEDHVLQAAVIPAGDEA